MLERSIPLLGEAGGRTVLRLHPASLAGPVRVAQPLRDDSLEAALADRSEQCLAVLEGCDEPHLLALELELLEQRPSSTVPRPRARRTRTASERCRDGRGAPEMRGGG